jgi:tetratricopeptide (TPR) repeat protein
MLFVAGLLPVLGLSPFLVQRWSTVADRFVYLSMFGVALAAAWLAGLRWTRPAMVACSAIVVLLAARSMVQVRTWRDRISLYSHAVAITPQSAGAHNNYGSALWRAGDANGARREFERAIELDPTLDVAKYNLELINHNSMTTTRPSTAP